jgi:hypothetical protein
MHWHIPTELVDATEGGTFWQNACLADGARHTEDPKKITCRACKAIYAQPRNPRQASAKLLSRVFDEQEEGRKSDFQIEVICNSCESDLDVFGWLDGVDYRSMIEAGHHFLEHVAFEHGYGADVLIKRTYTEVSAYELNYAMQKQPATMHEEAWRAQMELA